MPSIPSRQAVSDRRRSEIDGRLATVDPAFAEACAACGHHMVRMSRECWSDCGCRKGKHAPAPEMSDTTP